jgi:hypothetical protein
MTAKDKAKELVDRFRIGDRNMKSKAKQCALICVDEIVEFGTKQGIREPMMYWSKVKQEIQKLKN